MALARVVPIVLVGGLTLLLLLLVLWHGEEPPRVATVARPELVKPHHTQQHAENVPVDREPSPSPAKAPDPVASPAPKPTVVASPPPAEPSPLPKPAVEPKREARIAEPKQESNQELKASCELHPQILERVKKDVSLWGIEGITEDVVRSVEQLCKDDQQIKQENCNVRPQRILIENGNVYLNNLIPYEKLGQHEHIGLLVELYEASKVYKLPNVEFVQWFDDHPPAEVNLDLANNRSSWPHGSKAGMAAGVPPVVSWGKSEDSGVMMVPYCGAFRCPADSFDALAAKIDTEERVPWAERTDVAFGRWNGFCTYYYGWPPGSNAIVHTRDGKPVPCPRLHLNSLSEAHPDLLDAYDLGKRGPVPLAEQRKYKYIVSTDGWSISSKFDKYLLMGSTVLKAESHRIGFYYPALRPREHFLPFMVDSMDDIVDVVKWAREHDAEAKKIGESAAAFARQHLSRPARLCYLFHVVNELSKQFKYTPSCSRRKLCVPLVDELQFLSEDERANGTCNYREVLDKYGKSDAASSPKYGHKELLALHTDPLHWPRDDVKA